MNLGLIAHIADGVNGHTGLGIDLSDVIHQSSILLLVDNRDDFLMNHVVVCADRVIQAGTAVQFIKNILDDVIDLWRNNAYPALDINAKDKNFITFFMVIPLKIRYAKYYT